MRGKERGTLEERGDGGVGGRRERAREGGMEGRRGSEGGKDCVGVSIGVGTDSKRNR